MIASDVYMISITRYTDLLKEEWDRFIETSKNGTFLFFRNYMDYHSDRFTDNSLLIYRKEKLAAVFPANRKDSILYSHQGLTYGGLIYTDKISATDILAIFEALILYCKENSIEKIVYKAIPYIYSTYPAQEDMYALFKNKAELVGCHLSSTIPLKNKLKFIESRKSGIRKANNNQLKCYESTEFDAFWKILEMNLVSKYEVKPVHSVKEIQYLHQSFSNNIKLYVVKKGEDIIAGTVLYIYKHIVHVQYISANCEGRELGALDLLFDYLINVEYKEYDYFDFGQSTEQMGNFLNENLLFQKEGFGGRSVIYPIYELTISSVDNKPFLMHTVMIHKSSDVQSLKIGKNTTIWQFCVVLPKAEIGDNCNIGASCFIENDVKIGNNVTLKCGVSLWDGIEIEDNVFVGPDVTFTNDKYPRSKHYPENFLKIKIKKEASIGAGSVILGGITIGEKSMIGAGSVVTKDVPDGELWFGNPATFIRKIEQ